MNVLLTQLEKALMPGMEIPPALIELYNWIENNNYYIDKEDGYRIGFLYPDEELKNGWTETERPGGTIIEFYAEGNTNLEHWFGVSNPEVLNKLCVFAQTGAEGSMVAFWLDPDGNQKIVHLGSGSGSTLVCVLAENAIDFLRLIAIGYDEICWNEEFSEPPNTNLEEDDCFVKPNIKFQTWVSEKFNVEIPKTASEVVKHPSEMGDENSSDAFFNWVESIPDE